MAYTLTEIRPDDRRGMEQLRALLEGEGISLDANLDYTCGLLDEDYNLAATGSTFGNTLRCFAVAREHQGEGLLNQVVSHLMERQMERGMTHLFVYTKTRSAKFSGIWVFTRLPKWRAPSLSWKTGAMGLPPSVKSWRRPGGRAAPPPSS